MTTFSQIFPPAPAFTEKSLGDLSGKVCIVTGAASGVGLELAKMLYAHHATVYVGARSLARAEVGIHTIHDAVHSTSASAGRLVPLAVDLSDLTTVKPAVDTFLASETRLHVLVHNAGVMTPPPGSRTAQDHDLEMGTNCLAPFLLTRLLEPALRATSREEEAGSVRIVWVASMISTGTPRGGVQFDQSGSPRQMAGMDNYMQSKAGMVFLAAEFAKRVASDGILSVSLHPGLMKTELQRHLPSIASTTMSLVFKPPRYGAYTELFAAFSPELTLTKDSGTFLIPWGRRGCIPLHLQRSMKGEKEGGTGVAAKFYNWAEEQVKPYM